jgi:2-dehydro-3-deoxyphosphogluconate aldolase / (4S)-4-hydroxy-2-oxoglutarate aldolase
VATAADLMTATALGLSEVKFFPAGLLGGPAAIRAPPRRSPALRAPAGQGTGPTSSRTLSA